MNLILTFYETHIHQKAYLNALKLDYEGIKPNLTPIKAPILKHNPFEFPLSLVVLIYWKIKKELIIIVIF